MPNASPRTPAKARVRTGLGEIALEAVCGLSTTFTSTTGSVLSVGTAEFVFSPYSCWTRVEHRADLSQDGGGGSLSGVEGDVEDRAPGAKLEWSRLKNLLGVVSILRSSITPSATIWLCSMLVTVCISSVLPNSPADRGSRLGDPKVIEAR